MSELTALDAPAFSAGVDTLVARRLLVPGTSQSRKLGFRHALIREAAYDRQLTAPRRSLHSQAGAALARLRRSGDPVPAEQIASQFVAAGERATAFQWWQQASRDSVASAANVEAIEHCRQALLLLDVVDEGALRDLAELELQLTLAFSTSTAEGYASPRAEEAYLGVTPAHLWATSSKPCRRSGACGPTPWCGATTPKAADLAERAGPWPTRPTTRPLPGRQHHRLPGLLLRTVRRFPARPDARHSGRRAPRCPTAPPSPVGACSPSSTS
ncbi:MAG: hypothetical protein R2761_14125 [Acidimicrobiales bacterium]